MTAPHGPASILIVDDDEAVTQTFAKMLRMEGFEVRTANSAEAAFGDVRDHRPDAIILDLRMPLVDGLGFLKRLRESHLFRKIPVGILTGDYHLEDHVAAELRALGAEVRFKPLWLDDLVALARTLLKVTS